MKIQTQIINSLKSFKTRKYNEADEHKLLKEIDSEINNASNNRNELLANELWHLKTLFLAQNDYLRFLDLLLEKSYYQAWCTLEQCEIKINSLNRHIDDFSKEKYYFHFLNFQVSRWQAIFPYKWFTSPEFRFKKVKCSICKKAISPRGSCSHIVGELYSGKICHHIIEDMELIGVAITQNPVMKSNVIDPKGENQNFSGLKTILDILPTPFHYWEINYTKESIPKSYMKIASSELCPCGSNLSYLLCCQGRAGILIPHLQILPIKEKIENKLDDTINIQLTILNYLRVLQYS
ncbi:hypothetical protein NYR79_01640 [Actinobacillus equuli subsp. haemolyticus]|uniref:hypothetical protein n=2 Tax=Actinobacillus equuli TaxID=718 RepID=UPI0024417610|nr:hypothetical protein [Actinobacillus equuli]WGE71598.1 hypothetical protein NYR79_01640 [Actinobacillus equuli subsp. haemolyticus]